MGTVESGGTLFLTVLTIIGRGDLETTPGFTIAGSPQKSNESPGQTQMRNMSRAVSVHAYFKCQSK